MKTITIQEIKALIELNHVVFPYPKKGFVSVDGFKKYKASDAVFSYLKTIKAA